MATVCSLLLAEKGYSVRLWSYCAEHTEQLRKNRENRRFLPGFPLPETIEFTAEDESLFNSVNLAISAVPCVFLRQVCTRLSPFLPDNLPIVSVTKGIENQTLLCPTQILAELLGPRPLAVLSGPNIAEELARKLPATTTIASCDSTFAQNLQSLFRTDWFRVYTNSDMRGVELAGATKNVIAIAAGILDGLCAGDNAKAALLTRGLVEITRLGVALGANKETFVGLSGMGDLVTTCISPKGRNRSFGQNIGQGKTVRQALSEIPGQVEGVPTCQSLIDLARKHRVEMPITRAVYEILYENKPVRQAVHDLMIRELKAETLFSERSP